MFKQKRSGLTAPFFYPLFQLFRSGFPDDDELLDVPDELPPLQFFSRGLSDEDELPEDFPNKGLPDEELLEDFPGVLYVLPLQLFLNLLDGLALK